MSYSSSGTTPLVFPSLADLPLSNEECHVTHHTATPCDASESMSSSEVFSPNPWTPYFGPVNSGPIGPWNSGFSSIYSGFPQPLARPPRVPVSIPEITGVFSGNAEAGQTYPVPSAVFHHYCQLVHHIQPPVDPPSYSGSPDYSFHGTHDSIGGNLSHHTNLLSSRPPSSSAFTDGVPDTIPYSSNAAPRSLRSSLRNPEFFDGTDPSKLHPFLAQCYLHFAERPRDFRTDDDKNLFILSFLRGDAARLFTTSGPQQELPWQGNFSLFIMEFFDVFGPPDPTGDAEDQLRRLRMKHSDRIIPFLVNFDKIASLLDWSDSALSHALRAALPLRITSEMDQYTYPSSLEGVRAIARRIDYWYWQRIDEEQGGVEDTQLPDDSGSLGGDSGSSDFGTLSPALSVLSYAPSAPSVPQSAAPELSGRASGVSGARHPKFPESVNKLLGKNRRILPAEHERRKVQGLCMYCGGSGHKVAECRKRPGHSGASSSAKSTDPTNISA